MKRLLNKAIVLALMAVTWVGCSQDEVIVDCDVKINTAQESESGIPINLTLSIPDAVNVGSRTGITEVVQNITVLCFDQNHKLLSSIPVEGDNLITTDDEVGRLSVVISNKTRILHLIANQTIDLVEGDDESELNDLEADSNKMVYWARMEVPVSTSSEMKEWANGTKYIRLLRNMAKVLVTCDTDEFVLLGYTVVNINKKGYVAPYNADDEVFPTNTIGDYTPAFTLEDWSKESYVHAKGTEIVSSDWILNDSVYVYETLSDTKPCIIIKGRNAEDPEDVVKYWRVAFSEDGETMLNIRRNHRYQVTIDGELMYGDLDFDTALNNETAANNAWLSIADEVTAIKNRKFSLTVENTSYVKPNGTDFLKFHFEIGQLGATPFTTSDLKVEWANGQTVSSSNEINYHLTDTVVNGKTIYKGTVNVQLKSLAEDVEKQEGTIVIRYGTNLQRKVKIIVVSPLTFSIVSYNGIQGTEDQNTGVWNFDLAEWNDKSDDYFMEFEGNPTKLPIDRLRFSIPEDFPESMYPFNVLISCNDLNAWGCPLVFPSDNGYLVDNGIGFKYVYTITGPQDYYEVILRSVDRNLITDQVNLTLESLYFNKISLNVVYPDLSN